METNGDNGQFNKEKVIDLIRKCLALSESPNENEAAAAMAKAQALLDKYNLSHAEITLEKQELPELIEGETEYSERWEVTLYTLIAQENFCRVIFHSSSRTLDILGRYPNVVATQEMATWLISQLNRLVILARQAYSGYSCNDSGRLVRLNVSSGDFRRNFLIGATRRVVERLHLLNQLQREDIPNSRALITNLQAEADNFFTLKYPHTRGSSCKTTSHVGYDAGQRAADGVSIIAPSRHIETDSGKYLNSGR